jgi:hypothetical protein
MVLSALPPVVPDTRAFDRVGSAWFVACCAAGLLSACSGGRLDTFEEVRTAGGQAGAQSGGAGAGGTGAGGGAVGGGGNTNQSGGGGTGGEEGSLLIDDFEDQDEAVGPDGWWYAITDETGPPPQITFDAVTDRGDSHFVLHVAAGPTTGYGSFLGLDLPGGPLFDATRFSVLSFWARMEPAGELSVRFVNARSTHFQQVETLDTDWREFRLPLADFVPVDEGAGAITLNELTHLQLWEPDTHAAYDLYVDDVWLLREP